MALRIYLAGKMRGMPDRNRAAFEGFAQRLRSLGHVVFNPHEADHNRGIGSLPDSDFDPATTEGRARLLDIMQSDLAELAKCDCILLMPSWMWSTGAALEKFAARYLGLTVIRCGTGGELWIEDCDSNDRPANYDHCWSETDFTLLEQVTPRTDLDRTEASGQGSPAAWAELIGKTFAWDGQGWAEVAEEEDILDEAKRITSHDRNVSYGDPNADFQRTADVWSALFGYKLLPGQKFSTHDIAAAMIALKLSRAQWSPNKRDHWVDMAGYARCGWRCVTSEGSPNDSPQS